MFLNISVCSFQLNFYCSPFLLFLYVEEKKEKWKWRGERIEKVQIFKYLGFMGYINRKGNYKEHIKELANKDNCKKSMGIRRENVQERSDKKMEPFQVFSIECN